MKQFSPARLALACTGTALALIFCAHLLLERAFQRWKAPFAGNAPLDHLLGQGRLGPFRAGAGFTYYEPGSTDRFVSGGYTYWDGHPGLAGAMALQHQGLSLSPKEGHRLAVTFGAGTRDFTLLIPVGR